MRRSQSGWDFWRCFLLCSRGRVRHRAARSISHATLEQLEKKIPLAVDVSLNDFTLTLTYGADADAAVLAIDDYGNYTVTGLGGTVITGAAAAGNYFDDVMAVAVVNSSGGRGQVFTFTSTSFIGLLEPQANGVALAIGSANSPIATVGISAPEFISVNGPVAIYADQVSITGTVYGPGESFVIQATGVVDIDDIDEFGGAITITCHSFSMSGSLLNDGWWISGPIPDSGGLVAGTGSSITIDASDAISVSGSVSSNGGAVEVISSGAGFARAGSGGSIVLTAGGSISVLGVVSAAGGSVFAAGSATAGTATAGAGGSLTMQAGGAVSVGGLSAAGGNAQAGTTTTGGAGGTISLSAASGISVAGSISTAGGTGQTSSGASGGVEISIVAASPAASMQSFSGFAAPRLAPLLRTRDIVGGDVRLEAEAGVIAVAGNITASGGDVLFAGPVRLDRPARIDTSSGSGDVTFTSTVGGRQPLAIAAGTGSVAFRGVVGGRQPLAGLRFESAGSVTAGGRVNVAGGVRDAFRHGIEIFPGVDNVRLTHGGTIRHFTTGQAVHIAAGTTGSLISGFRMVNSGRPFVGWGGAGRTASLANNIVVTPVLRGASARITSGGGRTNDPQPVISGTGRTGDRITLYANGVPVGATVAAGGTWTIVARRLVDGAYNLRVRALGPDGVASGVSPAVSLAIKSTRPPAPTVALAAASDTGIRGDMTTSITRPLLLGTGVPGSVVQVSIDSRLAGRVAVGPNGLWQMRIFTPLLRGEVQRRSQVTVTATDDYGNTSPVVSTTLVTVARSIV